MYKIKQPLPIKGLFPLVLLSFLYDFSMTLLSPIYPVFINQFVLKEAYVGYLVAGVAFLAIIYGFVASRMLEKIKKITLIKISLIGFALTTLAFSFVKSIYGILLIEIFRPFFITALIITTALLIRETTTKKNLGKTEGFYFTVVNLAWMLGPLIGGLLAKTYNYNTIFYISAIFPIISLIMISYAKLEDHNHTHPKPENISANFSDFKKQKNLPVICFSTLFLLFWWSMVYTFLPLYVRNAGYGVHVTGYVLFLIILPLILLEVPAGSLADKFGYRKFFVGGFILMAILGIATFFVNSHVLVLSLIILGSIGAAFVEPLREALFFKSITKKDETRFYPIYKMALPLGQFIGLILFSTVLLFFNFRILFLFIGILMLIAALINTRLKEV